jgi:hypothetical protein
MTQTKRRPGRGAPGQVVSAATGASLSQPLGTPRCRRCRRPLATDLAVAARLGPVCALTVIAASRSRRPAGADPQDPLPGLDRAGVCRAP